MDTIIIYHAYCSDGLGAAWAFRHKMPNAIFCPAIHNTPPPDVAGKDVYILDFSYSRQITEEIKAKAKSLTILDHHKSAMEKLGDLPYCTFDMKRSGAGMAWDHLFPNRHWIIDYTEDCDLWTWKLPNSREINSMVKSYPLTFETLDNFEARNIEVGSQEWNLMVLEGAAIRRAEQNMVAGIVRKAREVEIQGYKVLMVNSPVLQSDVAGTLASGRPFGVSWFENEAGEKVFSLRSDKNGIDVAVIAAMYPGGGGHAAAAGFRLPAGASL